MLNVAHQRVNQARHLSHLLSCPLIHWAQIPINRHTYAPRLRDDQNSDSEAQMDVEVCVGKLSKSSLGPFALNKYW